MPWYTELYLGTVPELITLLFFLIFWRIHCVKAVISGGAF